MNENINNNNNNNYINNNNNNNSNNNNNNLKKEEEINENENFEKSKKYIDIYYDKINLEISLKRRKILSRRDCPYLDTIRRELLDFDFEKACSITLQNLNVYACLVCGKYFQGKLDIYNILN